MKKLIALLTFVPLFGAKTPTHNLIVLLDYGQSEELQRIGSVPAHTEAGTLHPSTSLGAITSTALPALFQQAAPILISKSILKSIACRKKIFKDFIEQDLSYLKNTYRHQPITRAPSLGLFKQHCRYALSMYQNIKADLEKIFNTGSEEEIRKAIDTLTSNKTYLEASAPRSLQIYSSHQSYNDRLHRELQVYLLCYLAPLEQYAIKDVSPEAALLVPHTNDATYIPNLTEITPAEKACGLKLQHLNDLTIEDLRKKTPIRFDTPLSALIKHIMVTKAEGSTAVWALYMAGHGLPAYPERQQVDFLEKLKLFYEKQIKAPSNQSYRTQQTLKNRLNSILERLEHTLRRLRGLPPTHERVICSTSCAEFQKTLSFFNTEIDVSLLYYTCCFAGGDHLDTPYRNKTYTYDIIVGSVSDAESFQDPIMLLIPPYASFRKGDTIHVEGISSDSFDTKRKCLTLRTTCHFDKYFAEARKPNRNTGTLAQLLHPYVTIEHGVRQRYHENIAHVRPAGSSQFTIIPAPAIHTVSQHDTTVLPESSEVVCVKHAKMGNIIVNNPIASIISLLPGAACHMMSSVRAPKTTLSELADACLTLPSLSSSKVFYVKEIECKSSSIIPFTSENSMITDVVVLRNVPTTEGLRHNTMTGMYYTDQHGTCWYTPVHHKLGSPYKASGPLAYGELTTLFPELKEPIKQHGTGHLRSQRSDNTIKSTHSTSQ